MAQERERGRRVKGTINLQVPSAVCLVVCKTEQPTVIALCTPFHARCYATGGKDSRFLQCEVFQFNYIMPEKRKSVQQSAFSVPGIHTAFDCDSSLSAYLLRSRACIYLWNKIIHSSYKAEF